MSGGGYIAAYICRVPAEQEEAFLRVVGEAAAIVVRHGALACEVFAPAELAGKYGCLPFTEALEVREGERVYVEVMRFRDRAHHDEVMSEVDSDPVIDGLYEELSSLMDMGRVVRGEFEGRI